MFCWELQGSWVVRLGSSIFWGLLLLFWGLSLDGNCRGVVLLPRKLLGLSAGIHHWVSDTGLSPTDGPPRCPSYWLPLMGTGILSLGMWKCALSFGLLFLDVIKDNYVRIVVLRELSGLASFIFLIFVGDEFGIVDCWELQGSCVIRLHSSSSDHHWIYLRIIFWWVSPGSCAAS